MGSSLLRLTVACALAGPLARAFVAPAARGAPLPPPLGAARMPPEPVDEAVGKCASLPDVTSCEDGYLLGQASVERCLAAIRDGQPVVVTDDVNRENEGDLIAAAECMTAETLAFIVRYSSGVICAAAPGETLDHLNIGPMVSKNEDPKGTAFGVSIDLATDEITTGISAADRASTLRAMARPDAKATDFNRPGHIFPLRARAGGVLERDGHTEATVDLCRLAGLAPVGALCEIVNDDGTMMRMAGLEAFAKTHSLAMTTIQDLMAYRRRQERLIEHVSSCELPTKHGEFTAHCYRSLAAGEESHELIAIVMGEDLAPGFDALASVGEENPAALVRVHSECATGDIFGSLRCDCGEQLQHALKRVAAEGRGVVIYVKGHEGRGIGLAAKLRAYALQDEGLDTVDANKALGLPVDARTYGTSAQILKDLGVRSMRLITNNPAKVRGLAGFGLQTVERVPSLTEVKCENREYLATKVERMGHWLRPSHLTDEAPVKAPRQESMRAR